MTDNSAEREAEKILEEAARKIQTEQCPQGEECAVHHRVDEEYTHNDSQYARYITYVGDYVVITEDNHIFDTLAFAVKMALGGLSGEDFPPRWETSIFHVGTGVIGDLVNAPLAERGKALRYAWTHDDWDVVRPVHINTVSMLKQGLIDVSKPLNLED